MDRVKVRGAVNFEQVRIGKEETVSLTARIQKLISDGKLEVIEVFPERKKVRDARPARVLEMESPDQQIQSNSGSRTGDKATSSRRVKKSPKQRNKADTGGHGEATRGESNAGVADGPAHSG